MSGLHGSSAIKTEAGKNFFSAKRKKYIKNFLTAMLFISPFTVGFLLFILYPVSMSLYYSFTDFSILRAPQWVGVRNYVKLFGDPLFWQSISNTLYLIFLGVPLTTILSLLIAVLLNRKMRGIGIFRTMVYVPTVVPPVAVALLWAWILNPHYGLLNSILGFFQIEGPGWLGDYRWSKPAILLMLIWGLGNVMVLYLAALQDVPRELYEACQLDGGNAVKAFIYVTIPSISPVIFYNVITGIIGLSQFFTQAYVISSSSTGASGLGAPRHSTLFYSLYLYQNGFAFLKMGYASAMAWILLAFSLAATWLLLRYSGSLSYDMGRN